tara:strand:- start:332 stop:772 length:441 start_codon:yes stop_codon:yes gene_type:complete
MMGKRTPFEYHKAFEDVPNVPVIEALYAMQQWYMKHYQKPISIIFTSARENVVFEPKDGSNPRFKDVAELTEAWVDRHIGEGKDFNKFVFRKAGDYRKDAFVKFEIGKEIMEEYDVLCVFDDRNQVVDMWRNGLGLQCFQVADGNF